MQTHASEISEKDMKQISKSTYNFINYAHYFDGIYPDCVLKQLSGAKNGTLLRIIENPQDKTCYLVFIDDIFTAVEFNKRFLLSPTNWVYCGYNKVSRPIVESAYYDVLKNKYPGGFKIRMRENSSDLIRDRKCLPINIIRKIIGENAKCNFENDSYIYVSKISQQMPWIYFYEPHTKYVGEILYDFINEVAITSNINNADAHQDLMKKVKAIVDDNCVFKYDSGNFFDILFIDRIILKFKRSN